MIWPPCRCALAKPLMVEENSRLPRAKLATAAILLLSAFLIVVVRGVAHLF